MTVLFVSRHPGALQWAQSEGVRFDRHVAHLDPDEIASGDVVIGTLPVHLAAQVCARGGRYLHLAVAVPACLRGAELTGLDLVRLGARLQRFDVHLVPNSSCRPHSSTHA